jgi:L-threonylcarbamoyladenylate synthase
MVIMSTITQNIDFAITHLRNSDVVAIPTETVYGLAGNAEDETAIKKIFSLKNRPLNHPLILHIAKRCDVTKWALSIPNYAEALMDKFWPGPLTLVFNCKPNCASPLITGGQTTIAIRCPEHPVAQSLLSALDFPLVAPSANRFGKISPTTAAHVQHSFQEESLLILDGGRCNVGIESTRVAATNPDGYQILRHGMVDEHALNTLLPKKQLIHTSNIRVPGKLNSHYQPEKPLYCFKSKEELLQFCHVNSKAYVLSFHKNNELNKFEGYQLPDNPQALAYELYYQLRCADQSSSSLIAIELPPNEDAWEGVRERILKASTWV